MPAAVLTFAKALPLAAWNPALLGVVVVVVGAIAVIVWLNRGASGLEITVRGGEASAEGTPQVTFRGAVPQAKQPEIARFFAEELAQAGKLTIRGRRSPTGWRFAISGNLPPGEEQRIRNFLLSAL